MARKNKKESQEKESAKGVEIHPDIKKSVWVVVFLGIAILLILASAGEAGPLGNNFYGLFNKLFGLGYYLLPTTSFLLAFSFIAPEKKKFWGATLVASLLFVASGLGFLDIVSPGRGGAHRKYCRLS